MNNFQYALLALTLFAVQAYGVETQKPISTEVHAQVTLVHSENHEDYAMAITFEKAILSTKILFLTG